MTTTNDITGDKLVSKASNDAFRSGWDAIFSKKEVAKPIDPDACQICGYGVEHHEFGVPAFQCLYPPLAKPGDEMSNRTVQYDDGEVAAFHTV